MVMYNLLTTDTRLLFSEACMRRCTLIILSILPLQAQYSLHSIVLCIRAKVHSYAVTSTDFIDVCPL